MIRRPSTFCSTWILAVLVILVTVWSGCIAIRRFAPPIPAWPESSALGMDAGAVVLLDEGDFRIEGGSTTLRRQVSIRIDDRRGWRFADVTIPHSPQTSVDVMGRTVRSDGTVVPLRRKDVHEVSLFPEYALYSDLKAYRFTLPAIDDGSVIQYEYTMSHTHPVLSDIWYFQWEAPVACSRFCLTLPRGWRFSSALHKGERIERREEWRSGTSDTHVWEMRDIPAIPFEPYMPPWRETVPWMAFSCSEAREFHRGGWDHELLLDWDHIADLFNDLAKGTTEPTAEIEHLVNELMQGVHDPQERARRIFHWIQENIRYVAIEIWTNYVRPHEARTVYQNRYGDCKDMAVLLVAMLEVAGIESHIALVRTRERGELDESVPSLIWFDHAVVAAYPAGELTWLDPTTGVTRFGELPWPDQGAWALIVLDEGGELVKTSISRASDNSETASGSFALRPDGSLHGTIHSTLTGQTAMVVRKSLAFRGTRARHNWIEGRLSIVMPGATLTEWRLAHLDEPEKPLEVAATLEVANYAMMDRPYVSFDMPFGALATDAPFFATSERIHPIQFEFPVSYRTQLSILLPEGYEVLELPHTVEQNVDFGSFMSQVTVANRTILWTQELSIERTEIPSDTFAEVRQFFDTIHRSSDDPVLVSGPR
jgi:hypothetical protein